MITLLMSLPVVQDSTGIETRKSVADVVKEEGFCIGFLYIVSSLVGGLKDRPKLGNIMDEHLRRSLL